MVRTIYYTALKPLIALHTNQPGFMRAIFARMVRPVIILSDGTAVLHYFINTAARTYVIVVTLDGF